MKKEDHTQGATRYLCEAIEKTMFSSQYTKQAWALKELLSKLNIKSARNAGLMFGAPLQMEGLSATLKSATFNYGKSDSLMMDPKTLEAFKKLRK